MFFDTTDSVFPTSPFDHTGTERMTEEQQVVDADAGMTPLEWSYLLVPRVVGTIFLSSSLVMLGMAWKRREFVFHRLALGMGMHMFALGVSCLVGSLAIPSNADGYFGNKGTTGTCTAQGFFIAVSFHCMNFYYAGLSFYSYVGILSGFQKEKYEWCEKWIHIFVPIYPVGIGIYGLVLENFNPWAGVCTSVPYPYGCTEGTCERGVPMDRELNILVRYLPQFGALLFAIVTMVVLYIKVKIKERHQQQHQAQEPVCVITSKDLLKQSFLYLSAMFVPFLPRIVSILILHFNYGKEAYMWAYETYIFFQALSALVVMLTYRYFSMDRSEETTKKTRFMIFSRDKRDATQETVTAAAPEPVAREPSRQYSFNIFDGTNASSTYALFVHEGDSDDEQQDNAQTEHWSAVQDHI